MRDRVTLDAWRTLMPASIAQRRRCAVPGAACRHWSGAVGRRGGKTRYIELVLAAAREWDLPEDYICSLERWLPARLFGVDARKIREFR
jgi:hypothetical protein